MTELETGVDQLMELVKKEKKLSVADAAKKLGMPEAALQSWVDFLVEEHVLGIEYKFTTPYIYVHSEERLQAVQEQQDEQHSLKEFKGVFLAYAREKGMPEDKLPALWEQHLRRALEQQKSFFLQEAQRADAPDPEALYKMFEEVMLHGA